MTIKRNMGSIRKAPTIGNVGAVLCAVFEYTFNTGDDLVAASDILEIGMLPAGHRPISATLIGAGFGATTATVGLMSGEPGADTNANGTPRTAGAELFGATTINDAETDAARDTCITIDPDPPLTAPGA